MADETIPPTDQISKDKARRQKLAVRNKAYRAANYEKVRASERIREARRKTLKAERRKLRRAAMSPDEKRALAIRQQIWRAEHHTADRAIAKRSYDRHQKDRTATANAKRQKDPQKWTAHLLASRLRRALRTGQKGGSASRDLGCSIVAFRAYIQTQFLPGMSWNNWARDGWHLDHIRPLASFDLTDREQFLAACHYTNYQPLWAIDNLRKGAKITPASGQKPM